MLWETIVRIAEGLRKRHEVRRLAVLSTTLACCVGLGVMLSACTTERDAVSADRDQVSIGLALEGDEVSAVDLEGQVVSGTIQIIVEVNAKSVVEVRFHLNGGPDTAHVATTRPFEWLLDTTTLVDGEHTVSAMTPTVIMPMTVKCTDKRVGSTNAVDSVRPQ